MKVLIRNIRTRQFCTDGQDAGWTAERRAAHDFGSSAAALETISKKRMTDVEVVLAPGEEKYDIAMPVIIPGVPPPGSSKPQPPVS